MTEENGDIGVAPGRCSPAPAGRRPDLSVGDDCAEPSPEDDWPFDDPSVDAARLRETLRESEADIAAGRTFGEDDIRARYGFPRDDVEVIRMDAEPDPDDLDAGYSELAVEFNSDAVNDERRAARTHYTGRPEEG